MSNIKTIEIKCLKSSCGKWFPSPIVFGDQKSFDTSIMVGNTVQCPNCNVMTACNKENMRVRGDKSGFIGRDT